VADIDELGQASGTMVGSSFRHWGRGLVEHEPSAAGVTAIQGGGDQRVR
jgi:hypothetical protein